MFSISTRHFALFLSLLFLFSCSRNPVTGKREVVLMSAAQEQALGDQADPSIVAQYGLYPDDKLQAFINEKGQQMAKVSHLPDQKFEFKLLDSPVVNAFAVPGGYVYFTRGIMAHFNNEAEFAGVLGHEIGHVTARHSAKQQSKQLLGQLVLFGGLIASEKFRQFANEASQGLGLLFLKFGRDDESQSDELGVAYSTAIGYDSHEMADFFQTLNRLSGNSGQSIPDFLSTHPNPVDRFNKVHQLSDVAQQNVNTASLKVNRKEYLNRIDGMVYGEDPRQGYVENNIFYHPELKFQYPVPTNWQLYNSPTQVQMAPSDGKALMIFTLSPEQTLNAASQAAVKQFNLNVIETKNSSINGYPSLSMVADQAADPAAQQQQEQPAVRVMSTFIKTDQYIYVFHGLSATTDFNRYVSTFNRTMGQFKKLTDSSKINVSPTTLVIKTVRSTGTLSSALKALGASSRDLEELAIVNGMELSDQVQKGSLLKTFSKQHNSQ